MPESVILAFDLGQTRFKVAAFDFEGHLLASEVARNVEHSDGSYAWQEPREWWDAAGRLSRALLLRPALAGRDVAVIGASGRGAGFVPVDAMGVPLAGSWSDDRHREHFDRLVDAGMRDQRLAGQVAQVARYLWMREAMPTTANRVARLLYAKDWLVYGMTGRAVTDPSSGPDRDDFDREAIAAFDVDPSLLPEVAFPWAVAGTLQPAAAAHLGLAPGVPVSVGGHDGICANLGAGVGMPGGYAITIGTHAVVRAVSARTPPGADRFYGMPPDRQVIGGSAVSAGRAADWFLDTWLAAPGGDERAALFARMDAAAATVAAGADGIRFLPFFRGQSAPEPRPGARAAFTGLRIDHRQAHLYRAVLEGSAFAIRTIWDQVRGWCGDPMVARFTGSGAASATWRQIIVDAIDSPVEVTDSVAEARGAAIYAALAVGAYPDVDAAAAAMVHPTARIEPRPAQVAAYRTIYTDWRRTSETTRPLDTANTEATA